MTVKDLIIKLQKYGQEKEITIVSEYMDDNSGYQIGRVTEAEHWVNIWILDTPNN